MKSSTDLDTFFDAWTGPHLPARAGAAWGVLLLAVAVASAVVAGITGWIAGPRPAALAAVGVAGGAAAFVALQKRMVLAAARARRVAPGAAPRIENLVAGLAEDAGIPAPELMIATRSEPNAFVWAGRHPVLAMTSGMVEGFALTELEAVVAHCLLRLRSPSAGALAPAVLLARVGLDRTLGKGRMVAVGDDVRAAALTRYPPALAAAIGKCTPERGAAGPAYFVAEGPSHRPVATRLEALADL